jgi:aryl-alcohol dehydrogenase-like predicted oxidoreductase
MITRRGFLGLIPGLGLAKSWALSGSGVPTRKFGRYDERVSVLGFGGHTLGLAKDIPEATRIAHEAVDCGVTFFDNAWCYHGGRAEEWMGQALQGIRDKAFVMTKCCTHHKPLPEGGKEGAMKYLEDSLRRLKTDRVDLWMLHQVEKPEEVDKFYGPGGAAEAFDLAKKQGKVRYLGFTGHTNPAVHRKILDGGYPFDASLQPVSALGTLDSRKFETETIPELAKRQIAVIGMKGFGGSKRSSEKGLMTAEKVMRYSLSYPEVCTHLIGVDKFEYVDQAVVAASKSPMDAAERKAFAGWCDQMGGAAYAMHAQPGHQDGACCGGSVVA